MPAKSRRKGKKGQLEVAHILREFCGCGDEFFQPRSDGQPGPPDLVLCPEDWPLKMIEIRRRKSMNQIDLFNWWSVVEKQAKKMGHKPIIVYRINGDKTWFTAISIDFWIDNEIWAGGVEYVYAVTKSVSIVILSFTSLLERLGYGHRQTNGSDRTAT